MPIYEYTCDKCGAVSEEFHGMDENPRVKCGECGGKAQRGISSTAVIFKGSGFYINDHGKKSQGVDNDKMSTTGKKGAKKKLPTMTDKPLPRLSSDPD